MEEVAMLPKDFYEKKLAAQHKSARMRVINRLREHGINPDSFPHRFLSAEEEAAFLATMQPWLSYDSPSVQRVHSWETVARRVSAWAVSCPEVTIWYDADPGNGGLVLPGTV